MISDIFEGLKLILEMDKVNDFGVVFISVLLEAFPFILIGTFVSAIIQILISEKTIARIIPKNKMIGLLVASLMGFVFPVCECTIVPIMRRLVKKGVPLYIAITFMLAVPIVNPVVLASTFYAFSGHWDMVFLRAGLGMIGAIIMGYTVDRFTDKSKLFKEENRSCALNRESEVEEDDPLHMKLLLVFECASQELFDVGRFLILGAFFSSAVQVFVPKSILYALGQNPVLSIAALMLMTFVLSLCSEVDAFVARNMMAQFTTGSIVGFLIYGPMIDIKNTIMLSGAFRTRFVLKLIGVITVVCFILSYLVNIFY